MQYEPVNRRFDLFQKENYYHPQTDLRFRADARFSLSLDESISQIGKKEAIPSDACGNCVNSLGILIKPSHWLPCANLGGCFQQPPTGYFYPGPLRLGPGRSVRPLSPVSIARCPSRRNTLSRPALSFSTRRCRRRRPRFQACRYFRRRRITTRSSVRATSSSIEIATLLPFPKARRPRWVRSQ